MKVKYVKTEGKCGGLETVCPNDQQHSFGRLKIINPTMAGSLICQMCPIFDSIDLEKREVECSFTNENRRLNEDYNIQDK